MKAAFKQYRILSKIGGRGQTEVWEAEQVGPGGFSRRVILKCLFREGGEYEPKKKVLLQEAKVVAELKHPNLVEIYEVGEEEDFVYLVMERIDGKDTGWLLKRSLEAFQTPFPWEFAAAIGIEVCKALQFAHHFQAATGQDSPVYHHALKPSKVVLSRGGFVKVIDFGIAKAKFERGERFNSAEEDQEAVGYLSPEQITDRGVEPRSALFSLGSLLYEWVSGEKAFQGEGAMQIAAKIVGAEPGSLEEKKKELPKEFARLVWQLLAKQPEARPSQPRLVQKELEQLFWARKLHLDQEKLHRFYEILCEASPQRGLNSTLFLDRCDRCDLWTAYCHPSGCAPEVQTPPPFRIPFQERWPSRRIESAVDAKKR